MVGTEGPGCSYWCWHLIGNNIDIWSRKIAHVASQVFPFILPLTYFFLLPRPTAFLQPSSYASYVPIPADDLETGVDDDVSTQEDINIEPKVTVGLSAADKWRLVKPMLLKYMFPLCEHTSITTPHFHTSNGLPPVCVYTVSSGLF